MLTGGIGCLPLAHHVRDDDEDVIPPRVAGVTRSHPPVDRHGYRPSGRSRIVAGLGTGAICLGIAAGLIVALDQFDRPARAPHLLTMALPPTAAASRPPSPPPPPRAPQAQARADVAAPPVILPQPPGSTPPVAANPTAPRPTASAQPAPPAPVTPVAAPAAAPAPASPAPRAQGPDKWEGRVLARLAQYRRYPAGAEHARQQGTAFVRFRIDRAGHVLSASLERSSGYPALDEAALDTLHRADPLPKIPPDRPDEVTLLVPVEFSIRG